jgi:large subunit ribosomal protein L31e
LSSEERIYTVPLGKAWNVPKYRRAEKAITILRKFTKRHMKPEEVVIDPTVNEAIWARGIKNPPRKIRVRLSKDDEGVVTVTLAEAAVEVEEEAEEVAEEVTEEEIEEIEEEAEAEPEESEEEVEEEVEADSEEEEAEEEE